jgi:periplasmic divalent cation tolerance protein
METEFILVLTTVENFLTAHQISKVLITEKLAACCTIVQSARSIYEWEGKVEERSENVIIIKTTKNKFEALKSRIKELHSDKLPEIVSIKIEDGLKEYLDWIAEIVN